MWMVCNWSKSQCSNIWGVFWMNQVQMLPSVIGRGKWDESCRCPQVPG